MWPNLKHDIGRYCEPGRSRAKQTFYLLFTQGIWAIAVYRFGVWSNKIRIPLIGQLLRLVYFFLFKFIEVTTGISVSCKAIIGKGFYIGHFGGIFVNDGAVLGQNCSIGQGVTIGTAGVGKPGAPKIGDNVYIGTGAKILGNITIGNNVRVGANAVVVRDIPDNATTVGCPAEIVKIRTV